MKLHKHIQGECKVPDDCSCICLIFKNLQKSLPFAPVYFFRVLETKNAFCEKKTKSVVQIEQPETPRAQVSFRTPQIDTLN